MKKLVTNMNDRERKDIRTALEDIREMARKAIAALDEHNDGDFIVSFTIMSISGGALSNRVVPIVQDALSVEIPISAEGIDATEGGTR